LVLGWLEGWLRQKVFWLSMGDALDLGPANAAKELGNAKFGAGEMDEANQEYNEALALLGLTNETWDTFEPATTEHRDVAVAVLSNKAECLLRMAGTQVERPESARLFKQALVMAMCATELDPTHIKSLFRGAKAKLGLGKPTMLWGGDDGYEPVAADLESILEQNPDSAQRAEVLRLLELLEVGSLKVADRLLDAGGEQVPDLELVRELLEGVLEGGSHLSGLAASVGKSSDSGGGARAMLRVGDVVSARDEGGEWEEGVVTKINPTKVKVRVREAVEEAGAEEGGAEEGAEGGGGDGRESEGGGEGVTTAPATPPPPPAPAAAEEAGAAKPDNGATPNGTKPTNAKARAKNPHAPRYERARRFAEIAPGARRADAEQVLREVDYIEAELQRVKETEAAEGA
jgi:hypothetical protein